jgi:ribosomal protein S17
MPRSLVGTARGPLLSPPRVALTAKHAQVVSSKMMKSVTVAVTRLFRHTRLGKTLRETKKYMVRSTCLPAAGVWSTNPKRAASAAAQAHDELNACGPGDLVRLDESRPLSRHKRCVAAAAPPRARLTRGRPHRWVVTEILRRERTFDHTPAATSAAPPP